jgi:glycosyltransferase involved in cell wall biosynthesis
MLLSLGHEVYLYGCEGSDAPCTEFVQTHTLEDIRKEWGDGFDDPLGYDWRGGNFRHDFNGKRTETTQKFYQRCVEEINKRKRPDDFLLLAQGSYHKPISDAVNLWLTCEPGVGYRGSFSRFKAFESAYLQNFTYGSRSPFKSVNGDYYDRVIPNYFDPKDFPLCEEKGDYYLFIGRVIQRKGVWTAIEATRAIGAKLIIAGQKDPEIDVTKLPAHVKFLGYLEPEQRAEVMGKAKAVFVPTIYLEAFGGVNVEAQLCGTPAICTSFGAFPETVKQGVTGFLCNTLQDFVDAAKKAPELDPFTIHTHASRYLMANVRHEYQRWFDDLYQLYRSAHFKEKGWSLVQ